MHTTSLLRALLPLVLLLAGCRGLPVLGPDSGGGEVARRHRVWEDARPRAYRYVWSYSCFCVPGDAVRVEVSGDRVTSVTDPRTGAPAPRPAVLYTVDGLFDAMERAERDGTRVRAEYHPRLGYPVRAEIGTPENDAGTIFLVSRLEAVR